MNALLKSWILCYTIYCFSKVAAQSDGYLFFYGGPIIISQNKKENSQPPKPKQFNLFSSERQKYKFHKSYKNAILYQDLLRNERHSGERKGKIVRIESFYSSCFEFFYFFVLLPRPQISFLKVWKSIFLLQAVTENHDGCLAPTLFIGHSTIAETHACVSPSARLYLKAKVLPVPMVEALDLEPPETVCLVAIQVLWLLQCSCFLLRLNLQCHNLLLGTYLLLF